MAIICWGNLTKSANSTEKIEESIQGYIESHDENPNAHMGADYALGVHRLQAVLDHADGSVLLRSFAKDQVTASTCFESLDGWMLYGTASSGILMAKLLTNIAGGKNPAFLCTFHQIQPELIDFAKNPIFQTTIRINTVTNVISSMTCGSHIYNPSDDFFGFMISNNELYAWWFSGGVEYTAEIGTVEVDTNYCLRATIDSINGIISFYVNGVLLHSQSTHLPTVNNDYVFEYSVESTDANNKAILMSDLQFQQDR
jgi:hypothetical protein